MTPAAEANGEGPSHRRALAAPRCDETHCCGRLRQCRGDNAVLRAVGSGVQSRKEHTQHEVAVVRRLVRAQVRVGVLPCHKVVTAADLVWPVPDRPPERDSREVPFGS